MTAQFRQRIDTTYADLRPSDLVIDKSGQAWPIKDLLVGPYVTFWLLDPVSKVPMHLMNKGTADAVKVSRLPTHADEASKLEAEFPTASEGEPVDVQQCWMDAGGGDAGSPPSADNFATMAEAVAAVEEIGGTVEADFPKSGSPVSTTASATSSVETGATGSTETDNTTPTVGVAPEPLADAVATVMDYFKEATVEAEVSAAEVDAAEVATDDAPLTIIPFADMTPLEARSHLFLCHGVYGHDLQGKAELAALHDQAHAATATLNSRYVPHVHEVA